MSYHFTPNMLPFAFAALVSLGLAWYTWQNRRAIGAVPFAALMLTLVEWEISYIFQLAGTDLATKIFWDKVMFLGVVSTPVAWMIFALEYTGRKAWINRGRLALLCILPMATVIVMATNEFHHLFWTRLELSTEGGFSLLNAAHGPWFYWIHALYSYAFILIGLVLIVRALLLWPRQYRGQMTWVLIATVVPFVANILFVFRIVPVLLDLTPVAFTVTCLGLAYAIFHHRLLDLAPIARDVVIDGMKDGMIVLDANRRIVDMNRAALEMIGLSNEQAPIGRPVMEVLAKWPALLERYRNIPEAADEINLGDGETERWIALSLSPLLDANKALIGRVITGRDITDRKRAENQLRESETRFRQIVENASDIIYRLDTQGCITYANPAAIRALGYESEQDVVGRHYLDMVAPEVRDQVRRIYESQFLDQTPTTYSELPAISADGREIWLGQNVQLICEGDQITGFQALARDITAIKEASDALRLAHDQALEANQAKTRLLSKVSHELRTPLGGILGYAELLQRHSFGQLNEKQLRAASEIVESADYLANLVSELLDESQLRSSAAALLEGVFSPFKLIRHATSGMDILAQKKGIQFSATVAPNLPQGIFGDERRIRQIIVNLIGNAIKFTKEGGVRLEVTCPDEQHWSIQVTDTGIGIPKEAQALIFEPFQQVRSEVTRDNRGIGLGLSITKQLVELMNGSITLESEPGQGSTFTVLLPIKGIG